MGPIYKIGFVMAQGWHGHHPSGALAAAKCRDRKQRVEV